MPDRLIGLMSGTSMDAVDAVLVEIDGGRIEVLAHHESTYPKALRDRLQHAVDHDISLSEYAQLDVAVGRTFAQTAQQLLETLGLRANAIRAIGSHGQTLRHSPESEPPYTLQIGDPNTIAELTGIDTVADFRRRDMAAGGHAAPLACGFHAHYFAEPGVPSGVLNLGGIANLTWLPGDDTPAIGFDTGPASGLMDAWSQRYIGRPYDDGGRWARSGELDSPLLETLLAEPYFAQPPPKTTGRDTFNLAWLDRHLAAHSCTPANVQRTLAELTVETTARAIEQYADLKHLYICGGGTRNTFLIERLTQRLPDIVIETTAVKGIDPQQVEATAFAWLAHRTLHGEPGNLPSVTGARDFRILGGIYQA
ncbi:anhydro-N-acetylmuramic acid kinase [Marinobacteraceae bacterium S3BR75-40.1]